MHKLGYLYHELLMWHNPGAIQDYFAFLEPTTHWENVETKRRFHNLVVASGLLEHVCQIKPRVATENELARVHDLAYIQKIKSMSKDTSKGIHVCGDETTFAPGGYEIAATAAGATLNCLDAVMDGTVSAAYALVRPPGHHAERSEGSGFCIFNNISVAAAAAVDQYGLQRVAIVDYDVHHGNGTQHIFEEDDRVLFISIHQDSNYPLHSGSVEETGKGTGEGYTINIPLPPGSGSGAYRAAFERVVVPALESYKPQLILVSSGFDASFMDNLAAMILSSEDYRWMARQLQSAADRLCQGRLLATHEGGYSELYVPFCGLSVLEELSGVKTKVSDPFYKDVSNWGYQSLQKHQDQVIKVVEDGPLALLLAQVAAKA